MFSHSSSSSSSDLMPKMRVRPLTHIETSQSLHSLGGGGGGGAGASKPKVAMRGSALADSFRRWQLWVQNQR